jgi:hypothetical protein
LIAAPRQTIVLVEGMSDQAAIETLAARLGRDMTAESVTVVPMGGATNIGKFVERFGPRGLNLRLAGLCDLAEEHLLQRGLERGGIGANLTRSDMERFGFFVCVVDLEDELIRAVGTDRLERIIEVEGEMRSFRTFQNQPAQRDRPMEHQLHRFMGTRGGRKIRYAQLLVEALDLGRVPRPLNELLAAI